MEEIGWCDLRQEVVEPWVEFLNPQHGLCWIIGQQTIAGRDWNVVSNETNTDVCMYTWRIYSSRCSHIAVQVGTEYALEML